MPQQRPASQPGKLQSKQQQHLDTLQTLINNILIETGKALRSANAKGAKTIAHDNDRLQMYMPKAITSFHGALDELESDIVRAKAVIARDLRELRRREEELRNPIAMPSESAAVITAQDAVDGGQAGDEGLLGQQADVVKTEEPRDVSVQGGEKTEAPATAVQVGDQTKQEPTDTLDLFQEQAKGDVSATAEKAQDEVKPSIEIPGNTGTQPGEAAAADAQQGDKTQDATENKDVGTLDTNDDMTYESLFGDKSGPDENTDLNLYDFDFGTDTAAGEGGEGQDYSMQNDSHIDLSTFGDDQQFGNDDGSSMLQGLESYANQVPEEGGGDINMLDTANTGSGGNAAGGGEGEMINLEGAEDAVGISGADLDMAMGLGGNETNFDDLLDDLDFAGGDDTTTGLENQEFDEAFFHIEDN